MTNQDTITVELPIEAEDDGRVRANGHLLSRETWRKVAEDCPGWTAIPAIRAIAPAVVAWIERDEWEPLPIPDVGRKIQARLRDGCVETFKVRKVSDGSWAWVWKADSDDGARYIQRTPDGSDPGFHDIIAWHYVDEPAEPATATVTIDVRANIAGLADDLQAAADAIRAGLTVAGRE